MDGGDIEVDQIWKWVQRWLRRVFGCGDADGRSCGQQQDAGHCPLRAGLSGSRLQFGHGVTLGSGHFAPTMQAQRTGTQALPCQGCSWPTRTAPTGCPLTASLASHKDSF